MNERNWNDWRHPLAYRAQRVGQGKFTRKIRSRDYRKMRRRLAKAARKNGRK